MCLVEGFVEGSHDTFQFTVSDAIYIRVWLGSGMHVGSTMGEDGGSQQEV